MCCRALLLPLTVLVACHAAPTPPTPPAPVAADTSDTADAPDPVGRTVGHAFLPADYQGELLVDWQALRECELLDRLLRLPTMEPMFAVLAQGYGARPDDFLRLRTAFSAIGPRTETVSIAEVTAGGGQRPTDAEHKSVTVGPHQGLQGGSRSQPTVMLWPTDTVAVTGPLATIEELIAGRRAAGGPHPDIRPLLAGNGVLAQLVYGRFGRPYDDVLRIFGQMFGDKDDPVDFVRLRLAADADGRLELSVTLRFQHGTTGLRIAEQTARDKLAAAREEPRLAPFRTLIADIALAHEGRDLHGRLSLGSARDAARNVERWAIAAMAMMHADAGKD